MAVIPLNVLSSSSYGCLLNNFRQVKIIFLKPVTWLSEIKLKNAYIILKNIEQSNPRLIHNNYKGVGGSILGVV